MLSAIVKVLSKSERRQASGILLFVLVSSIFEVISIASILPLIAILADSTQIETTWYLKIVYEKFSFDSHSSFSLALCSLVLLGNIISLVVRAISMHAELKFSLTAEYNIGLRLARLFLAQKYEWSLSKNSSSLAKSVLSEVHQYIHKGLSPLIVLIAQSFVVFGILLMLTLVNWIVTAIAVVLIFGFYLVVNVMAASVLAKYGEERVISNDGRFRFLSEIFNSIKEIKLSESEEIFIRKFDRSAKTYATANIKSGVIAVLPRFAIEGLMISGVLGALVALILNDTTLAQILPTLTLFVVAFVRLLPACQQCYSAVSALRFNTPTILKLLDEIISVSDQASHRPVSLDYGSDNAHTEKFKKFELKNLYFQYEGASSYTLKNINFSIEVGEKVGIIGTTGSGKTTLLNIVLGLLEFNKGHLFFNDEEIFSRSEWLPPKRLFGYVPQDIVLLDDDIENNIAFGLEGENISPSQIDRVTEVCDLTNFIKSLDNGYKTQIGEKGAKVSGGQKQRLGIARAILRGPSILVLDEGTSALDNITENKIMQNIDQMHRERSILVVAHRLTTVKNCDRIYVLKEGEITMVGSYEELEKESGLFV